MIKSANILKLSIENDSKGSSLMIPPNLQKDNLYIILRGDNNIQKEKLFFKSQIISFIDTQNHIIQLADLKENPLPMVCISTNILNNFKYFRHISKFIIFQLDLTF